MYEELRAALAGACGRCGAGLVALSGGLDSTIIAHLMRGRGPAAVAVIAEDFVSTDLTYCQLAAKEAGLRLAIREADTASMLEAVEETIGILGNFNDIEVRNCIVTYLAARWAADNGHALMATGDGADELFAGYGFMARVPEGDLAGEIERVCSVMHFPSDGIGRALGVGIESPFLDKEVVELASRIPAELKVRGEGTGRTGKWVLRKAFEGQIPAQVAWRPKSPMQDGAGTAGLTGLFESLPGQEEYEGKILEIAERDGVTIRSRESLHYYEIYRKKFGAPSRGADPACPYCGHGTGGSRFCRMCGAFPI